jgi:ATP-dependent RNA helicase RhlE
MPPKIIELAQQLLFEPVSVNVTPKSRSVDKIEQRVLLVQRADKHTLLREILGGEEVGRTIVFTRTKRTANLVERKLAQSGINAAAIHGNKSQNTRQRVLDAFRRNHVKVLVATDVAARGIDIDGITHVVNFDLPAEPESYVHRIGRTGRAGADGIALTFCTDDQRGDLQAIERLIGKKLPIANRSGQPLEENHQPSRVARRPVATRDSAAAARESRNRRSSRPKGYGRSYKPRVKQTT